MWCLRARRLVSAFLDHELDPATESDISVHFHRCGWCRKLLGRVRQGARLARAARTVSIPPPDLKMLAGIRTLQRDGSPEPQAGLRWLWPLATAATLLLAFALFTSPALKNILPSGNNTTVYALDFGPNLAQSNEDWLNSFRARYAGKFQEFAFEGKLDPNWVPFRFKHASILPTDMRLKSVMVFDSRFCGSLGLVYTDGLHNLYLVQQPADRPISLSGVKTTTNEVCKYNATHGQVGKYRVITWTSDNIRSVLLSNLDLPQIESIVSSLKNAQ